MISGMKLRKIFGICRRAAPFCLCAAVLLATAFYPHGQTSAAEERRVVRIWNVDTFEGGKGSRTAFLERIARAAEQKSDGVYYLVSSYTAEGARAALAEGTFPDALSFGVGLSDFAEKSQPLPYSFAGGRAASHTLAYPWCRGEYVLFCLEEDFSQAGETIVSRGGSNLTPVAARYAGVWGEERDSVSAYVAFLNGERRYLLGTQRDRCRFAARGVSVYERPLAEFCDLYQYFSVLNREKREDALAFLRELLSQDAQNALESIGMLPVSGEVPRRTVNVFSSAEALAETERAARENADVKFIEKYLKTI